MKDLTQENKNKLDDILKIVISTNSSSKSIVLTENTSDTNTSKKIIKSLYEALQKISENEQKIYGKLQELQNDVQNIKQEIEELKTEDKEKMKKLVDMAGSVQGNSIRYHTTVCQTILNAQNRGTIKNFRQVPDGTKIFRMYGQKPQALPACQNCINNQLAGINGFKGITLPPEINNNEILPDCFLLYLPEVPTKGFHFMKCKNIRHDENINWLEGYRFTNKAWFEDFKGNVINVMPCKDCLSEWDNGKGWQNFNSLTEKEKNIFIRYKFNIDEFFDYCKQQGNRPHELRELYRLMDENKILIGTEIDNKYPSNWKEISDAYRITRNYRCEECKVDLSEYHHLCVTHHINGCHFDVRPENIRVLCVYCHSLQPYHKKITQQELNLLTGIWKAQNINLP